MPSSAICILQVAKSDSVRNLRSSRPASTVPRIRSSAALVSSWVLAWECLRWPTAMEKSATVTLRCPPGLNPNGTPMGPIRSLPSSLEVKVCRVATAGAGSKQHQRRAAPAARNRRGRGGAMGSRRRGERGVVEGGPLPGCRGVIPYGKV